MGNDELDRGSQATEAGRAEDPDAALKRAIEEVRDDRRAMHSTLLHSAAR
ncbi:hypothetical protein [Mycobacterium gordonae]|nr:hypothetical protein [Mycobacterium gordonae]MCV7006757.1 hypothetical protein [Mycobacterium gordonae]